MGLNTMQWSKCLGTIHKHLLGESIRGFLKFFDPCINHTCQRKLWFILKLQQKFQRFWNVLTWSLKFYHDKNHQSYMRGFLDLKKKKKIKLYLNQIYFY